MEATETVDPAGARVVLDERIWREKIVRDHPEIAAHKDDALHAVAAPDHVAADPDSASRKRFYLRGVGPSRGLLVVVSYEQKPARIISEPEGPQDMERVNIAIGPLTFDRASYDAVNDVLYLHSGDPQPGEGEETPEGHVLRYAPGTSRVVGLTVVGARETLERHGRLSITVPETIETTAEELAPALAAA